MIVDLFHNTFPDIPNRAGEDADGDVVRIEVPLEAPDGTQYRVILLDADDSFDIIIHDPLGEREAVWSLVQNKEKS